MPDVVIDAVGLEADGSRRYMPKLLEHIREGRIDARALISRRMPLADVSQAYRLFSARSDDCRKVVLDPWDGAAA